MILLKLSPKYCASVSYGWLYTHEQDTKEETDKRVVYRENIKERIRQGAGKR